MNDNVTNDRRGSEEPASSTMDAKGTTQPPPPTQADMRRERAAQKLRENLQRRKHQTRARRAGEADEANGLPAAKMDES